MPKKILINVHVRPRVKLRLLVTKPKAIVHTGWMDARHGLPLLNSAEEKNNVKIMGSRTFYALCILFGATARRLGGSAP